MLDMKAEVNKLQERRKKMRRELYEHEDEIDAASERLQDEIRSKLSGTSRTEHIMTIFLRLFEIRRDKNVEPECRGI